MNVLWLNSSQKRLHALLILGFLQNYSRKKFLKVFGAVKCSVVHEYCFIETGEEKSLHWMNSKFGENMMKYRRKFTSMDYPAVLHYQSIGDFIGSRTKNSDNGEVWKDLVAYS